MTLDYAEAMIAFEERCVRIEKQLAEQEDMICAFRNILRSHQELLQDLEMDMNRIRLEKQRQLVNAVALESVAEIGG